MIERTRRQAKGRPNEVAVDFALGYFVNNVERMQYGSFRRQGFLIGSGVVEAGCKTVIGARCKQSAMPWSETGAENSLALRCMHTSRGASQFWNHRLDLHYAHNDPLVLTA